MKVEIVKCSGSKFWYNDLIGRQFNVEEYSNVNYALEGEGEIDGGRLIEICDCIIILDEEEKNV